jgi:DnaJ-class molecular chaperone
MFLLIIRALFFIGLVAGVVYLIQKILVSSDFVKCGRCDGKGFWYTAREREKCDWCKGSGKLPRQKEQD